MASPKIFYFSLSGTSRMIAEKISKRISSKMHEINPAKPYKGKMPLSGIWGVITKKTPPIRPISPLSPDEEEIILITPIWADSCPPPVRTFLLDYAKKISITHIITVAKSSDGEEFLSRASSELGISTGRHMSITEKDINTNLEAKLAVFTEDWRNSRE